jgi:riboflavin kinase
VCIVGYLRPERNFDSLEALVDAIKKDISDAKELLESAENQELKNNGFFRDVIKANGHATINGSHQNGLSVNGKV